MPEISIVMTAYKRPKQLEKTLQSIYAQDFKDFEVIVVDDGVDDAQRIVCRSYPDLRYIPRPHRPGHLYSNPAVPNNIGLRAATGNIILLQNAENMHITKDTINQMVDPVRHNKMVTTFASVLALKPNGTPYMWYVHSVHNPRPFFFCQAISRSVVEQLRGFDEDFIYYAYDDDDFAYRLRAHGLEFQFLDHVLVHHQYHAETGCFKNDFNQKIYEQKMRDMAAGKIGIARNLGKEWGQLEDVTNFGIQMPSGA